MTVLTWDADDFKQLKDRSGFTGDGLGDNDTLQHGYNLGSLTRGLIAYYPLDDGSGTTATDEAIGYDGTISGATWTSSTNVGSYALSFDGTDDYINVGTGLPEIQQFTGAFWIKLDSDTNLQTPIAYQYSDVDATGWQILWNSSAAPYWRTYFRDTSGTGRYADGGNANVGSWTFIVGTFDGDTLRLYQDGSEVSNAAADFDIGYGSNPFEIGRRPDDNDRYVDGTMSTLWVYDRPLSGPEVSALYALTTPFTVPTEALLL